MDSGSWVVDGRVGWTWVVDRGWWAEVGGDWLGWLVCGNGRGWQLAGAGRGEVVCGGW